MADQPSALLTIGQNIVTALNALQSSFKASSFSSIIVDVRTLGAAAGVNTQPLIASAAISGVTRFFLPAGFFYQGGGTGAQAGATEIPANVEIIGEDPRTSLIKAVDRTNSGIPGLIFLNNFSILTNCGTQSYPGDQLTSPTGVHPKTVMQPRVANFGDAKANYVPWTGSTLINSGANITSPEGVISVDNPGIQVVQNSAGDGFFAQTTLNGVAMRIQTGGSGDEGLRVDNGAANPANLHLGLHIVENGTNASSAALTRERANGSIALLGSHTDDGPATATATWDQYVIQFQSGGIIRNTFQATTPFSGIFDLINAGNSGGTFTGQFCSYQIAGVVKFQADPNGIATSGGISAKSPVTNTGATYTVLSSDYSLIANNAGATQTLTLLSAAAFPGRILYVKTTQNQAVVSASANVVPLAGGAATTAILSATAGKWAKLQSDATNWVILAAN